MREGGAVMAIEWFAKVKRRGRVSRPFINVTTHCVYVSRCVAERLGKKVRVGCDVDLRRVVMMSASDEPDTFTVTHTPTKAVLGLVVARRLQERGITGVSKDAHWDGQSWEFRF